MAINEINSLADCELWNIQLIWNYNNMKTTNFRTDLRRLSFSL